MSEVPLDNSSSRIQQVSATTTPPSHMHVQRPLGRMHMPHPRPTVSLDPRPVVIPILSSVIGFPILAFVVICALRHRAIKLRRRDHMRKIQAGIRSVTLDLPPRDKVSFFSGGSSPEVSMRDPGTLDDSGRAAPTSILREHNSAAPAAARSANRVHFVTPAATLDASHTMQVEAVLHQIAATAAHCVVAADVRRWRGDDDDPPRTPEEDDDDCSSRSESPR